MVETNKRKRSKSAPRKRRSRSSSASKPNTSSREKNTTRTELKDESSDDEVVITKRVTRQSLSRLAEQLKHDEITPEKPVPVVKLVRSVRKTNNSPSSRKSIFKELCSLIIYISAFLLVPAIFVLNRLSEKQVTWRHLQLSDVKYFCNWPILAFITSLLFVLGVLARIPIGFKVDVKTKDGFIKYRCNSILSWIITSSLLIGLLYTKQLSTGIVYNNYYSWIGGSITVALVFSILLLLKSYWRKDFKFAFHPGNLVRKFIIGSDMNPRFCGLDLKLFSDFRPGFIGWTAMNIIFLAKDLEENNYKSINLSLLLCAIGQIVYCLDAMIFESDIISKPFTMEGGFGFIHCLGNQVVMPFIFTLTSRAIQLNKFQLPNKCLVGIVILNVIGFIIYRSSNTQKNSFRKNPYSVHLSHLKTFTNRHGHQLLAGGWWGFLRHPNYLGDIIMSLSWSLYAGFHVNVCWFFPILSTIVIIIRCIRDDRKCSLEHGSAWDEYRKFVPYRLIPFVF